MSEGGAALMAVGMASGEDAARAAAEQAISSQLLDITIDGARGILFNVTGGPELTLFDVNEAAAIIKETAHPDVNLIFGAVISPEMKDNVRITVIATGFERTGGMHRRLKEVPVHETDRQVEERVDQQPVPLPEDMQKEFQSQKINTEDLDIPTFLRNRFR